MITTIIAVASFVIGLINLIYTLCTNSKKIDIQVENYSSFDLEHGTYFEMNIQVINKSRLPISINEISIDNESKSTFIKSPRPILVHPKKQGEQIAKKNVYSSSFPINIPSLSSSRCIIVVYAPKELERTDITIFNVSTNRGKSIKKEIELKNRYLIPEEFGKEMQHFEEWF